jgi:hypothetical protein
VWPKNTPNKQVKILKQNKLEHCYGHIYLVQGIQVSFTVMITSKTRVRGKDVVGGKFEIITSRSQNTVSVSLGGLETISEGNTKYNLDLTCLLYSFSHKYTAILPEVPWHVTTQQMESKSKKDNAAIF